MVCKTYNLYNTNILTHKLQFVEQFTVLDDRYLQPSYQISDLMILISL